MKHLAVIREYEELRQALCARRDELDVTHGTLDELSGLQGGYVSKVLAPRPKRGIGPGTLGPLLGALGLALVLVEDTAQLERVRARLLKRQRIGRYAQLMNAELTAAARILHAGVILTSERGRELAAKRWSAPRKKNARTLAYERGKARWAGVDETVRKAGARKAAKARWKKLWSKPVVS